MEKVVSQEAAGYLEDAASIHRDRLLKEEPVVWAAAVAKADKEDKAKGRILPT